MFDILEVKKALKEMQKFLTESSDEKLIEGYKNAMKDYEDTKDEQKLRAADFIKKELKRRDIDTESL